jgi:hypothetical protein
MPSIDEKKALQRIQAKQQELKRLRSTPEQVKKSANNYSTQKS